MFDSCTRYTHTGADAAVTAAAADNDSVLSLPSHLLCVHHNPQIYGKTVNGSVPIDSFLQSSHRWLGVNLSHPLAMALVRRCGALVTEPPTPRAASRASNASSKAAASAAAVAYPRVNVVGLCTWLVRGGGDSQSSDAGSREATPPPKSRPRGIHHKVCLSVCV